MDGKEDQVEEPALEAYSEQYRETTGEKGKPREGVTKEQCGRINADTLKKFDVVLFFTTGKGDPFPLPMTDDEEKDLVAWVKAGGAFAGTHCATDTLYTTPYGQLIGALFQTPPLARRRSSSRSRTRSTRRRRASTTATSISDEMYHFREPVQPRQAARHR